MTGERVLRVTLAASAPFNFVAAAALAFPTSSLAKMSGGEGVAVPPLYAYVLAYLVALFGVVYGWMAVQRVIYRPLVAISAVGKAGVFVIAAALWAAGDVSWKTVGVASGDLTFAAIWTWWLVRTAAATGGEGS